MSADPRAIVEKKKKKRTMLLMLPPTCVRVNFNSTSPRYRVAALSLVFINALVQCGYDDRFYTFATLRFYFQEFFSFFVFATRALGKFYEWKSVASIVMTVWLCDDLYRDYCWYSHDTFLVCTVFVQRLFFVRTREWIDFFLVCFLLGS